MSSYQDAPPGGGAGTQTRFALPPLTPVVKHLMLINVGVYLFTLVLHLVNPAYRGFFVKVFSVDPAVWRSFFPFEPIWQLLTYGFVHADTPGHVFMNMLGLYFFGTMVEDTIGPRRFLFTYLCAIFFGGIVYAAIHVWTGYGPLIGASGGVLAMIVAAAVFRPNATVIFILFPIQLKWLAGILVAMDLINGALSWRAGVVGGTAFEVHLAGALFGFLAVKRGWVWSDPIRRLQARRAIAQEEKRQNNERRMDELLAKISREGIQSLSRRERDFLKRVSSRRDSA